MVTVTADQLESIKRRIGAISSGGIRVAAVDVDDVDGTDGPTVVVTVTLASVENSAEWDPDDFLALRRDARTAAVDVLSGEDVRLVYASEAVLDSEASEADVEGAKQADEGEL